MDECCSIREADTLLQDDLKRTRDPYRRDFLQEILDTDDDVAALVQAAALAVAQFLADTEAQGFIRVARLPDFRRQLDAELLRLGRRIESRIAQGMESVAQTGRSSTVASLRQHMTESELNQFLQRQEVQDAVRRTVTEIIRDGSLGQPLGNRVDRIMRQASDKVMTLLYANAERTRAGDLRSEVQDVIAGEKGSVNPAIQNVTRTELTAASEQTKVTLEQESGIVTSYLYQLSPEHPRPDICDSYHNRIFPIEDEFHRPPVHPNCICFALPRFDPVTPATGKLL